MKTNFPAWCLIIIAFTFGSCSRDNDDSLPDNPDTEEYFTWRIASKNDNVNLISPGDSVVFARYPGNFNVIVSYNADGTKNSYISYYGPLDAGIFNSEQVIIYSKGSYYVDAQPTTIHIYSWGATGQPITGTYYSMLKDSVGSAAEFPALGNFKITNPY
jgi:hypothetical protein